jgi:hypothetical protein
MTLGSSLAAWAGLDPPRAPYPLNGFGQRKKYVCVLSKEFTGVMNKNDKGKEPGKT